MKQKYYVIGSLEFRIKEKDLLEYIKLTAYNKDLKDDIRINFYIKFVENCKEYFKDKLSDKANNELLKNWISISPHKDFNGDFILRIFDKVKDRDGYTEVFVEEETKKLYILE